MLRILDMGSNDGWVGAWLKERYDGKLVIDGIELNPDAVRRARHRGYGKVAQARAEDAATVLKPGSYDAVVMYELVEHVPDTDALFDAAEQMLRPGGRCYVSTPNGTFGAGENPHHLRAWTAIDFADLLRRRGTLEQFAIGPDGISLASYTPVARRGEVAVFTGPSLATWAPFDIETRGLGGSETAAVRLSEALADLGYLVTVYGDVEEGCHHDVIFRPWQSFDPAERRLAVIASRMPEVFERHVNAQARLLWLHDVDCGPRLTETFADRIDRVVVLSDWHRRHVEGAYPFLAANGKPSKIIQSRNGINLPYFAGEPVDRARRLLYTSSPDRGLDILLELWPRIREQVPDATFAYCYPGYFDQAADQSPELGAFRDRLRELGKQDGVEPLPPLPQHNLAQLMRGSMVWAHPSWCTPLNQPFAETSCIGAMEAQAAGLHVVASGWGALAETVKVGRLVGGDAPGADWKDALVGHIVEGLTKRKVQKFAQTEGPKAAADLGWASVAVQFAGMFEGEIVE